ncbi:MAG TPA: beta-ketoacyl-[acyl-carrier-protein] synthase II, partial [Caldilineaceae bacterium]|nr:beta-ketoacyl-[acyl-carrier-protein] synthase II [Caldilineaceae bacterium]
VRALETGFAPPTINYTPDPELGVDVVANVAEKIDPKIALVEAFGFGGQNVVVAFKRWEG